MSNNIQTAATGQPPLLGVKILGDIGRKRLTYMGGG